MKDLKEQLCFLLITPKQPFFIIDKNNLQSIKSTSETLNMGDKKKFLSFNINTLECDGHVTLN